MSELPADRDDRGRFLRGHGLPGPGRPKGVDIRALAEERSAASGEPLADQLWAVLQAMIERAKAGDVQAARLLLDRLADNDPTALGGLAVAVLTGVSRNTAEDTST